MLAQVQLLQAVRFGRGAWTPATLNRISQLSIDFLVVTPDTRIIAAIELNDATHQGPKRQDADARKAHALKSAGIPLLVWPTRELPDVQASWPWPLHPGTIDRHLPTTRRSHS